MESARNTQKFLSVTVLHPLHTSASRPGRRAAKGVGSRETRPSNGSPTSCFSAGNYRAPSRRCAQTLARMLNGPFRHRRRPPALTGRLWWGEDLDKLLLKTHQARTYYT